MWASTTAFIIPTIIILGIWISIALHLMENPGDKNDNQRESIRASQNRRITVVMSVITLVFLICLWPYALKLMSQTNNELLLIIFALLLYTNRYCKHVHLPNLNLKN